MKSALVMTDDEFEELVSSFLENEPRVYFDYDTGLWTYTSEENYDAV